MKKFTLFCALAVIMLATSCTKDETIPNPVIPDNLNDLKVSATFKWITGLDVNVNITGLPTTVPVKATLSVSLNNGSLLYQSMYEMSLSSTIKLTVPSSETQLKLKYGSVEHLVPITGTNANFSFIPTIQD